MQGERGATLILAIAFLVVVGAIGAAMISSVTSGFNGRTVLDQVRNRQYAADGAIERSIAKVRANSGVPTCTVASPDTYSQGGTSDVTFKDNSIRVDCTIVPGIAGSSNGVLGLQNNVAFTACPDTGAACTTASTIIQAQVNFQSTGSPASVSTSVQAWSVNR
jgi:hypothetical protein